MSIVKCTSNSAYSEGLERTKEAIEEEIQKRGTHVSEYKTAKDTEQFLESTKQFIEEKNKVIVPFEYI